MNSIPALRSYISAFDYEGLCILLGYLPVVTRLSVLYDGYEAYVPALKRQTVREMFNTIKFLSVAIIEDHFDTFAKKVIQEKDVVKGFSEFAMRMDCTIIIPKRSTIEPRAPTEYSLIITQVGYNQPFSRVHYAIEERWKSGVLMMKRTYFLTPVGGRNSESVIREGNGTYTYTKYNVLNGKPRFTIRNLNERMYSPQDLQDYIEADKNSGVAGKLGMIFIGIGDNVDFAFSNILMGGYCVFLEQKYDCVFRDTYHLERQPWVSPDLTPPPIDITPKRGRVRSVTETIEDRRRE